MAFFAALLPTLLKAIMGSGAVAIPAMTGAAGAAGAAGGTVGGAIPDSVVTAEGAPMADAAGAAGGGVAAGGLGGGAGGSPTAPQSPQQIGPGGKYGGTDPAGGGMRPTMRASEISGVPDDWLPYKVPETGFGRFLQRWGGEDPAAGNARFIANKQQYGMEKAMDMEKEARASQDKFGLQKKEHEFQGGQNKERTEAERNLELDRRGFSEKQRLATEAWTAKNQEYRDRMAQMNNEFNEVGSHDPIVKNDFYNQRREAMLSQLQAPVGLPGGGIWDRNNPGMIGIPDRGQEQQLIGYEPGTTKPIMSPGRPPGIRFSPMGAGGGAPQYNPSMIPPQGAGGSGVMPVADPSRLQYLPPTGNAPVPQAQAQQGGFFDEIMKRLAGGRPNMYSAPR